MIFLQILVLIACVEGTTNILSKSKLFEPVREFLLNHNTNRGCKFTYDLLACPYCTSVWVSLFFTAMFFLYIANLLPSIFLWFFVAIAVHRASNLLHFLIDRADEYHLLIPDE